MQRLLFVVADAIKNVSGNELEEGKKYHGSCGRRCHLTSGGPAAAVVTWHCCPSAWQLWKGGDIGCQWLVGGGVEEVVVY
jgi:hypothetical protein